MRLLVVFTCCILLVSCSKKTVGKWGVEGYNPKNIQTTSGNPLDVPPHIIKGEHKKLGFVAGVPEVK